MGSQVFRGVTIPLLWGNRAIVQDHEGRLSIIDVGGAVARPEVVGDHPAPGIEFVPTADGFEVMQDGKPLYSYSPSTRTVTGISLSLPPCQIGDAEIRVGTNVFSGNVIVGFDIGIAVSESGISMGAPLPHGLAKLIV
jgi:hypothetical protein